MTTLLTLLLLLVFGIVVGWLVVVLLPFVGLPGVMVAGEPGKRSKLRLTVGVVVAAMCQSYFYLGYVAFLNGWTSARVDSESVSRYFIWAFAFLSSVLPIWVGASILKVHYRRKATGLADVTVEAANLTGLFAFVGFIVFTFASKATTPWNWLPYVGD